MIVVSPSGSIEYRSNDNGTVLAFVAAGTGIALVPELALDAHDERTRVLNVDGLLAARHRPDLAPRARAEPGRVGVHGPRAEPLRVARGVKATTGIEPV